MRKVALFVRLGPADFLATQANGQMARNPHPIMVGLKTSRLITVVDFNNPVFSIAFARGVRSKVPKIKDWCDLEHAEKTL